MTLSQVSLIISSMRKTQKKRLHKHLYFIALSVIVLPLFIAILAGQVIALWEFNYVRAESKSYYVSTSGSDSNTGSSSSPLRSIQKAVDLVNPGDTVYIRAGTYAPFVVNRSGNNSAMITVTAYENESVIVNGAKSGVTTVLIRNAQYIRIKGLQVTGASGDWNAGIRIQGSNNIIESNKVYGNNNGSQSVLGIWGHGNNNSIINNEVFNNYLTGITLSNEGGAYSGNSIIENVVYNNYGGGDSDGIQTIGITGTLIKGNRSYNNADDGFDTWTSSNNTLIDNISYNNKGPGDGNGFKLGGTTPGGNNFASGNIAYGNKGNGFDGNGSGGNQLYQNVAYNNGNFGYEDGWRHSGQTSPTIFINNIGYNNIQGNFSAGPYTGTANYNLFFTDGKGAQARFDYGQLYSNLAAFALAYNGMNTNSISANPQFISPSTGNFSLQASSPAIDRGDNGNPGLISICGANPDIGALEYCDAPTGTPVFTPAPTTQVTPSPTPLVTPNPTISPTPTPPLYTLHKAVNLNGPTLNVGGLLFQSESQAGVVVRGKRLQNQTIKLNPATSNETAQMIRSSIRGRSSCGSYNPSVVLSKVTNDQYRVYLYNWEDNYSQKIKVYIEGTVKQSNITTGPAGAWRKLGPYDIAVSDGTLNISLCGGEANLSAVEIWKSSQTP